MKSLFLQVGRSGTWGTVGAGRRGHLGQSAACPLCVTPGALQWPRGFPFQPPGSAQRASFGVMIRAAFLLDGSVTKPTTVGTTQMSGTAVTVTAI